MSIRSAGISQILDCAICAERYDDRERRPKLLQCGHTFCKRCLGELSSSIIQQDKRGRDVTLQCPSCRQTTCLNIGSCVSQLSDNFAIISFLSCEEAERPQSDYCKRHRDEKIKFFCAPCQRLLCPSCALQHVSQSLHKVEKAESAAMAYREQIHLAIVDCKEKQKVLDKILQDATKEKQQLEGLSQSFFQLLNTTSDVLLLSRRQMLKQLEDLASQACLATPLTLKNSQSCSQVTAGAGFQVPPGVWCTPDSAEKSPSSFRVFQNRADCRIKYASGRIVRELRNHRNGQELFNIPIDVIESD
ncbi:tripartite motif-containing protein 2-like [Rhinatrema bivittatum]|uniref:tripartite motif-containing protein 2-like n=1 Tax=Rhinatrema bivittatum TaxID=194408 RepID=UPI00112C5594|nr:tripartite motif-containing protein 2-like [Rhinatrema bivittatum]